MELLLDTNVLVWLHTQDPRLSRKVLDRMASGDDRYFVSVVSGWEYEHKRLTKPDEVFGSFASVIADFPHERLDLAFDLYKRASSLPLIHRDPFDRMLVAQALHHDLTLVASDSRIARYPVPIFW